MSARSACNVWDNQPASLRSCAANGSQAHNHWTGGCKSAPFTCCHLPSSPKYSQKFIYKFLSNPTDWHKDNNKTSNSTTFCIKVTKFNVCYWHDISYLYRKCYSLNPPIQKVQCYHQMLQRREKISAHAKVTKTDVNVLLFVGQNGRRLLRCVRWSEVCTPGSTRQYIVLTLHTRH